MWSSSHSSTPMSSTRRETNRQNRQNPQKILYKYVKPSQQIYRPPSARPGFKRTESPESQSSSTTSTSQSYNESNNKSIKCVNFENISNVSESSKSSLRRSKSFRGKGVCDNEETIEHLMAIDGLSWERTTLVRRAIEKTNSLTVNQLMQIVRILCNKALEKSCYSHPLAIICLTINEKQTEIRKNLFIESLLNCLREWFSERDKLRATLDGSRRWTAFVAFISELYINMKTRMSGAVQGTTRAYSCGQNDNDFVEDNEYNANETNNCLVYKQRKQLSVLVCDSLQEILIHKNSTNLEIECIRTVLHSCGKYLEEDNPSRMKTLMVIIRDLFLSTTSAPNDMKIYLEIIELSASGWRLSQEQLIYYFPYTKQLDN